MDNENNDTLDLRAYWSLLRHWAWLLALATILAGAAGFIVSRQVTPVYQARTRVLIDQATSSQTANYTDLITSERLARTYSELITTAPILQGVIEEMELPLTVEDLKESIKVSLVRDTQLIDVAVEHEDPATAAEIANQLVEVFVAQTEVMEASRFASSKENLVTQLADMSERVSETSAAIAALPAGEAGLSERPRLETTLAQYRQIYANLLQSYEGVRLAEAQSTSNLIQVEPAVAPRAPVRPQVFRNSALAAVVGLMLAVGVIFLIEALDDSLRDPAEIERKLGLPVLGYIDHIGHNPPGLAAAEVPRSQAAERYRALRTNIQYTSVDSPIRTLMISSPAPQEGKSTTALNLATVMAQSGRRVILVDADLRRPNIHRLAGLANGQGQGLSEMFIDPEVRLTGHLKLSNVRDLWILPTGALPPNPSELLNSSRMDTILTALKAAADIIIIDCPPITAVTDAAVLAPRLDAVLLIVKPGVTKQVAFQQAVEQFQRVRANLIGVVLNDLKSGHSRYGYHYYGKYASTYKGYQGPENGQKPHKEKAEKST